jgi:hypothetical protein
MRMSPRDHAILLVTVIVGLGLSELLAGLHRLVRARHRVRWHPLPLLWAVLALILVSNYWWGVYLGLTGVENSHSAGSFLLGLLMPILLYLVCAATLPAANVVVDGLDLRAAYYEEAGYFFTLLLLYVLVSAVQVVIAAGAWQWSALNLARLGIGLLIAPLIWLRRPWCHWAVVLLLLTAMVAQLFLQAIR